MKTTIFRDIVIDLLRRRDGNNCNLCSKPLSKLIEVDHIVPRSFGGGDTIGNLQLTHTECNQTKGANFVLGFTTKTFIRPDEHLAIPLLKQLRFLAVDEALRVANGRIKGAAKILGVDEKTIYRWRAERNQFAQSGKIARIEIPLSESVLNKTDVQNPQ